MATIPMKCHEKNTGRAFQAEAEQKEASMMTVSTTALDGRAPELRLEIRPASTSMSKSIAYLLLVAILSAIETIYGSPFRHWQDFKGPVWTVMTAVLLGIALPLLNAGLSLYMDTNWVVRGLSDVVYIIAGRRFEVPVPKADLKFQLIGLTSGLIAAVTTLVFFVRFFGGLLCIKSPDNIPDSGTSSSCATQSIKIAIGEEAEFFLLFVLLSVFTVWLLTWALNFGTYSREAYYQLFPKELHYGRMVDCRKCMAKGKRVSKIDLFMHTGLFLALIAVLILLQFTVKDLKLIFLMVVWFLLQLCILVTTLRTSAIVGKARHASRNPSKVVVDNKSARYILLGERDFVSWTGILMEIVSRTAVAISNVWVCFLDNHLGKKLRVVAYLVAALFLTLVLAHFLIDFITGGMFWLEAFALRFCNKRTKVIQMQACSGEGEEKSDVENGFILRGIAPEGHIAY